MHSFYKLVTMTGGGDTGGAWGGLSPPTFTTGGAEPPHFSYMTCIGHHKMLSGEACPKQDNQETKVFSPPTFNLLSPPLHDYLPSQILNPQL